MLADLLELCPVFRVRKDDLPRQGERCTTVQLEDQQCKSDVTTIFENMKNSYRKMTTSRTSRYRMFQTMRRTFPNLGGNGGASYSPSVAYLAHWGKGGGGGMGSPPPFSSSKT